MYIIKITNNIMNNTPNIENIGSQANQSGIFTKFP
jgi:hypothetical protein